MGAIPIHPLPIFWTECVPPPPDPRKSTVEVLTAKEMELEVEPLEGKDII